MNASQYFVIEFFCSLSISVYLVIKIYTLWKEGNSSRTPWDTLLCLAVLYASFSHYAPWNIAIPLYIGIVACILCFAECYSGIYHAPSTSQQSWLSDLHYERPTSGTVFDQQKLRERSPKPETKKEITDITNRARTEKPWQKPKDPRKRGTLHTLPIKNPRRI